MLQEVHFRPYRGRTFSQLKLLKSGVVLSSKVVGSLSREKFKQRLNEPVSGIQCGSKSKVLLSVSFSSISMHFERHFTYRNLVPPRDSFTNHTQKSKLLSSS